MPKKADILKLFEKRWYAPENIVFSGSLLMAAALPLSKPLVSIATIIIFLGGLMAAVKYRKIPFKGPDFLPWLLLFAWQAAGFIYAADQIKMGEQLRLILPMFAIPFTFSLIPVNKKQFRILLLSFTITVFVTALLTMARFLLNYEEMTQQIIHSKAIPVISGMSHIYFSCMIAVSVFAGISIMPSFHGKWKWLLITLTAANFIFLHLLTARTGILGFYFAGFILMTYLIISRKKYKLGLGMLAVFIIVPMLAYLTLSPVRNRVKNSLTDIEVLTTGQDPNYYSFSMRVYAWMTARDVFRDHPVTGVSMADIEWEMMEEYLRDDTPLMVRNRMLPHNQFLEYMAGGGLIALAIFSFAFFYPLFRLPASARYFFIAHSCIFLAAFFFESMLERQYGITLFFFFRMLVLSDREMNTHPSENIGAKSGQSRIIR